MKTIQVPCAISGRHVHLSHQDYATYVNEHGEVTKKRSLSQGEHWAANQKVSAYGLLFTIVMPPREETAYELSLSDAKLMVFRFSTVPGYFRSNDVICIALKPLRVSLESRTATRCPFEKLGCVGAPMTTYLFVSTLGLRCLSFISTPTRLTP